jgi:hypothetical protein
MLMAVAEACDATTRGVLRHVCSFYRAIIPVGFVTPGDMARDIALTGPRSQLDWALDERILPGFLFHAHTLAMISGVGRAPLLRHPVFQSSLAKLCAEYEFFTKKGNAFHRALMDVIAVGGFADIVPVLDPFLGANASFARCKMIVASPEAYLSTVQVDGRYPIVADVFTILMVLMLAPARRLRRCTFNTTMEASLVADAICRNPDADVALAVPLCYFTSRSTFIKVAIRHGRLDLVRDFFLVSTTGGLLPRDIDCFFADAIRWGHWHIVDFLRDDMAFELDTEVTCWHLSDLLVSKRKPHRFNLDRFLVELRRRDVAVDDDAVARLATYRPGTLADGVAEDLEDLPRAKRFLRWDDESAVFRSNVDYVLGKYFCDGFAEAIELLFLCVGSGHLSQSQLEALADEVLPTYTCANLIWRSLPCLTWVHDYDWALCCKVCSLILSRVDVHRLDGVHFYNLLRHPQSEISSFILPVIAARGLAETVCDAYYDVVASFASQNYNARTRPLALKCTELFRAAAALPEALVHTQMALEEEATTKVTSYGAADWEIEHGDAGVIEFDVMDVDVA